jgi:hypothetical protein
MPLRHPEEVEKVKFMTYGQLPDISKALVGELET